MEKISIKKPDHRKQVVIIGPESTGKTTISEQLANYFNTNWLPEYSREYVEKLNRPYNYNDVEHIALKQIELQNEYLLKSNHLLFVDTDLIITKIWFTEVYKNYPLWIDDEIKRASADLYLLCEPDIEWIPDPLRENGGERRNYLFDCYKAEIEKFGFSYKIVNGIGNKRIECAVNNVKVFFEI